ncbi:MAG: replication-relaxation family protein [Pirellulales bacterium]|nr:replication-relaxation family protein [Pirellulales bacterium]
MVSNTDKKIDVDHLKTRDLELFNALWEGRFCTVRQASQYIWTHKNSCNKRLRQLEESGYIRRQKDIDLRDTIIRPTKDALDALFECRPDLQKSSLSSWKWAQLNTRKINFCFHEAQVNEIRFRLIEACQARTDITLLGCCSGTQAQECFSTNGSQRRLRPDRRLELEVSYSCKPQIFYVEVDCGTKPIRRRRGWDVVTQLLRYQHYYLSESPPPFRVLILCSSNKRVDNILNTLDSEADKHPLGALMRAYTEWDLFMANPLGEIWIPECAPMENYSIVDEWPNWPTF